MSKPQQKSVETHLPIRPVLAVFLFLLAMVALVSAIAGENQKIKITARKLLDRVAERDYSDAYDLLTEDAKNRISSEDFKAKMALLRTYLRLKYGPSFNEDFSYYYKTRLWIPWRGDDTRAVSVGLYRRGTSMVAEAIDIVRTPPLEGPMLENLVIARREGGTWKIDDIRFNPEAKAIAEVLRKTVRREHELFTPTENGFVFDGFVYDRRTATPDQRSMMLDALKQAIQEIEADTGKKKRPSDDFLKMIH